MSRTPVNRWIISVATVAAPAGRQLRAAMPRGLECYCRRCHFESIATPPGAGWFP